MKQPRRFTATPTLGPEGRLMAIGMDETPDSDAKHRVARRLGISAAALASAAATVTMTTGANAAAAATSAKAAGTFGAALGNPTGSFIAATLGKAIVIGLGLGMASYVGVRVYTANSSSNVPSLTAAKANTSKLPERTSGTPGVATETSSLEDTVVETVSARANAPSLGNSGATVTTTAPTESVNSLEPAMRPVGRFVDEAPPPALPSAGPSAGSFAGQPSPLDTRAVPSASARPVDPRLAREVASLDLVRASASRGDTAGALRELSGFERSYGYIALRTEAMLVNIDVLLSLGRRVEAAAIARQLLRLGAPATQRPRLEELVRAQP